MEEIELEIANLDYPQRHGEAFNLMLKQKNGSRFMPVVIGVYEAKTIIMEVNHIKVKRPLVHDLFLQLCTQTDCVIQKILINGYQSGIYYVQLQLLHHGAPLYLDSRVSDAVVLALKNNLPIFVTPEVFTKASYEIEADMEDDDLNFDALEDYFEDETQLQQEPLLNKNDVLSRVEDDLALLNQLTTNELKSLLQEALENEAYELAAQIDEELNRRQSYGK